MNSSGGGNKEKRRGGNMRQGCRRAELDKIRKGCDRTTQGWGEECIYQGRQEDVVLRFHERLSGRCDGDMRM
eukprot:767438-Hanusia_phi.AAC.3